MEHHQGRLSGCLSGERRQLVHQVTPDQERRLSGRQAGGGLQAIPAVLVLRPHERSEPGKIRLDADVERVEVDAGAPDHLGEGAGHPEARDPRLDGHR